MRFGVEHSAIVAYPWELLYDDSRGFIFANRRSVLCRYLDWPAKVPPVPTADALNLLLVTARPISQPTDPIQLPLLIDSESKAIADGLAEPLASGTIHLESLPPASPTRSTWDQLSDYLTTHTDAQAPHILHFGDHGGLPALRIAPAGCGLLNAASDTDCRGCGRHLDGPPQGYLAFEARNKRPHWVSARELSNLLADAGVRLAVLTSQVGGGRGPKRLLGHGAVADPGGRAGRRRHAVQRHHRGRQELHAQLLPGVGSKAPVTKAMGLARAALFVDETAWYWPVLYLRTDAKNPEGKLFERKNKPKLVAAIIRRLPQWLLRSRPNRGRNRSSVRRVPTQQWIGVTSAMPSCSTSVWRIWRCYATRCSMTWKLAA